MAQGTPKVKAVLFDFMGTCLDWHSSITAAFPTTLSDSVKSEFALNWRQVYFDANSARLKAGLPPEDIDLTHQRTLDEILDQQPEVREHFTEDHKVRLIKAWHHQRAWGDVAEAIRKLKENHGLEVFVHANGTTRLQLDLVKFSGLQFDMLFSSELLGVYKPDPGNYNAALKLIKRKPEECVLVAAHAYDSRGAKAVGMKTVYVYRWTDDIHEDQNALRTEFDAYLTDMTQLDSVILAL